MRRALLPLALYALLSGAYLTMSDAPFGIHVLSLTALAITLLVPSIWASGMPDVVSRLATCGLCAVVAMLFWDASAHLFIAKAEPFSMLLRDTWLYLVGPVLMSPLSFGAAWVAAPPDPAPRQDASQALRRSP